MIVVSAIYVVQGAPVAAELMIEASILKQEQSKNKAKRRKKNKARRRQEDVKNTARSKQDQGGGKNAENNIIRGFFTGGF
jgi:hypothetical protein